MTRNIFKTGKRTRPKTTVKGKRYRCARCRKRSPKPVKTPAPWYCPRCSQLDTVQVSDTGLSASPFATSTWNSSCGKP